MAKIKISRIPKGKFSKNRKVIMVSILIAIFFSFVSSFVFRIPLKCNSDYFLRILIGDFAEFNFAVGKFLDFHGI